MLSLCFFNLILQANWLSANDFVADCWILAELNNFWKWGGHLGDIRLSSLSDPSSGHLWKRSARYLRYLGVVSIHRLRLLAPPAQDARLIPATVIQHVPDQISEALKLFSSRVSLSDTPKQSSDSSCCKITHTHHGAKQKKINHLPITVKCSQKTLLLYSSFAINEELQFSELLGNLSRS